MTFISEISIKEMKELVVVTVHVHIELDSLPELQVTHVTAELGRADGPLEVSVQGLLGEREGAACRAHLILHLQPENRVG